jgi:hypothetical protein
MGISLMPVPKQNWLVFLSSSLIGLITFKTVGLSVLSVINVEEVNGEMLGSHKPKIVVGVIFRSELVRFNTTSNQYTS